MTAAVLKLTAVFYALFGAAAQAAERILLWHFLIQQLTFCRP